MKLFTVTIAVLSCCYAFGQREPGVRINDPDLNDEPLVIQEFIEDTLPSITSFYEDPFAEFRLGIGISAFNGGQTAGANLQFEGYAQVTDFIGVQAGFVGVFQQGDGHAAPTQLQDDASFFNSWDAEGMVVFTASENRRKKIHSVDWKYRVPGAVRYEYHGFTETKVRNRHQIRVGFYQQGGALMGLTSAYNEQADRYIQWNDVSIGSLMAGYQWRFDRLLEVEPSEAHFMGKNLSRSRVLYVDAMVSLFHSADGVIYDGDGNGNYDPVDDIDNGSLTLEPFGIRAGYRGTYLLNLAGLGFYHKYELGWRPSFNGSGENLVNVKDGSPFYFTIGVGIQF